MSPDEVEAQRRYQEFVREQAAALVKAGAFEVAIQFALLRGVTFEPEAA